MVNRDFYGVREPNFSQLYLLMYQLEQSNQTTVGKLRTSTIGLSVSRKRVIKVEVEFYKNMYKGRILLS